MSHSILSISSPLLLRNSSICSLSIFFPSIISSFIVFREARGVFSSCEMKEMKALILSRSESTLSMVFSSLLLRAFSCAERMAVSPSPSKIDLPSYLPLIRASNLSDVSFRKSDCFFAMRERSETQRRTRLIEESEIIVTILERKFL